LLSSAEILSSKVRPSPLFKKRRRNEEKYTRDVAVVRRGGCDAEGWEFSTYKKHSELERGWCCMKQN
jgi:hypothetical protein